jgi:receptor protein-tyrosine kinase
MIVAVWLVLGAGGIFAFFLVNPAVRDISDVQAIVPLPIAGWIEKYPGTGESHEVLPGIGRIRSTVCQWLSASGHQIVIASGDSKDGKSILASALAISLADSGLRVALVDVNFRNPSLAKALSIPDSPGLCDHLSAPVTVSAGSIQHLVKENLKFIPTGTEPVSPDMLEGETFKKLMRNLKDSHDVIIYDCSAASECPKSLALLTSDVCLLAVVRIKHTYVQSLKQLAAQLCQRDMAAGGLVFFGADEFALGAGGC